MLQFGETFFFIWIGSADQQRTRESGKGDPGRWLQRVCAQGAEDAHARRK